MNYRTIFSIKESEKATVELADVEGLEGPAIVKRLKGVNPDIYRLLCCAQNSHIPQVFFCEKQGEYLLVVEEYVDGDNLAEYLHKQQLSDQAKLGLALQLCEAVDVLHSMVPPVIHRDIKPSNIVITGKGVLKLIDFDASRQYKYGQGEEDTRLLGTRGYAAPEQFGYAQTDVRSDIYSMGIVFHEMKLTEHKKTAEQWEKIAEKCTSFDPKNRYQSVEELTEEIKKLKAWKKRRRRKLFIWLTVLLATSLVAGALIAGMWNKRGQESADESVNPTDTPVPTLEAMLTPNTTQAVTLTPEPGLSSSPTPTTEPAPSLSPTPTATLAPTSSPTPAVTPSPSPIEPSTPTPSPTISPTPIVLSTEFQYATNPVNQYAQEYHYYPAESEVTELIFADTNWYKPNMYMHQVSCYDYETGITLNIPLDQVEDGNGYVRISDALLRVLEPSRYQIWFYFKTSGENYYGTGFPVDLVLHEEGEEMVADGEILVSKALSCHLEYPRDAALIISSDVAAEFSDTLLHKQSNGATEQVESDCYELACDGKVIILKKEYLAGFTGGTRQEFTVWLEDGRQLSFQVNTENGLPDYITPEYLGLASTSTPIPTITTVPANINQHYYKSMVEETELILRHGSDTAPMPETWEAECYDYVTGETYHIPMEEIEIGPGYIRFLDEGLEQLEPSIYNLTVHLYYSDSWRNQNTSRVLKVYGETEYPQKETDPLAQSVQYFYRTEPQDFVKNITSTSVSRFSGVWVEVEGLELLEVSSEWYNLFCDGKVMIIEKEFLQQYYAEGQQIKLIYHFNDGKQQTMVINYEESR